MKHTMIPWKVKGISRDCVAIVTADAVTDEDGMLPAGTVIATCLSAADASFIVDACNDYVALLHALKLHLAFLNSLPPGWIGHTSGDVGLLNEAYLSSRRLLIRHPTED